MAVALFCGDTVASEASWSSLRYLLAAPVPRARLLRQKLAVALAYSLRRDRHARRGCRWSRGRSRSAGTRCGCPAAGVDLPAGTALARLGIVLGYILITELVVAALAFLLSVSTDSPLGAVGGAVGLVIVSNILDAVTALGVLARDPADPLAVLLAERTAVADHLERHDRGRRRCRCRYALVLFALAFRRFRNRDIVS